MVDADLDAGGQMKDTPETYEAVERWNQGKINIFDEMARLERERDDYMERCRFALSERDSWRMRAEQKYAMRRELEELLGVDRNDASDEQFQKGLDAIKNIIRERDEARHEIEGWSNKWECAVEMAARAEIERDEAREKCSALGKAMSYSPESTTLLRKFLQAIKERNEAISESEEQARLLGMSAEREESVRGKLFLAEREIAKLKAAAKEVVKVWETPPWKIGETPSNAITQLRDAIGYED
jgi:hypothetical protein